MSPHDGSGPGFDDMPLFDVPAAPASVRETATRRRDAARYAEDSSIARAASNPLRTADSIVAGHPVSVYAPAR